jgi:hypothetical protein
MRHQEMLVRAKLPSLPAKADTGADCCAGPGGA